MKKLLVTTEFINCFNTIWLGHSKCDVNWEFYKSNPKNDYILDYFPSMINDILQSFHWISFNENDMGDNIINDAPVLDSIYSINNWKSEYFNTEFINKDEVGYELYLPILVEYFNIDQQVSGFVKWASILNFQQMLVKDQWKQYISFDLRPNFFYENFGTINTTLYPELVAHNRELLSCSFKYLKELGYQISYLPIDNFGRAYSMGARWDETGFLDCGKYSKYSNKNLLELYKMMILKEDEISEIVYELQVRKIRYNH